MRPSSAYTGASGGGTPVIGLAERGLEATKSAPGMPGALSKNRGPARSLLERELLHRLRDAELQHGLGRNLDRLAGLRVAAHTSLALHHHQLADAREHETIARLLGSQRRELFEDHRALLLRDLVLVREVTRDLRLGHHLGHRYRSFLSLERCTSHVAHPRHRRALV